MGKGEGVGWGKGKIWYLNSCLCSLLIPTYIFRGVRDCRLYRVGLIMGSIHVYLLTHCLFLSSNTLGMFYLSIK